MAESPLAASHIPAACGLARRVIPVEYEGNSRYTQVMIDQQEIQRVAACMGRAANAERVVLFGSYARGDANESSDVDLMIIA